MSVTEGALLLAALLGHGWYCYRLGYKRAETYYCSLIDTIQYPPGCTCIKNALGARSNCPHHGHLSEFRQAS
jgi:hypothetical protein